MPEKHGIEKRVLGALAGIAYRIVAEVPGR